MNGQTATEQIMNSDKVQGTQLWIEQILKDSIGSGFQLTMPGFIFNLILGAILSYFLGWLYIRFGKTLSDRRTFARQFIMLTLITMLIISIVKSSLALSMGLVGALSIVRFRAAIKEPEELIYLFFAIGIGLGLGADLWMYTVVAFVFIGLIIVLRGMRHEKDDHQNLHIVIRSRLDDGISLKQIVDTLKPACEGLDLKRYDETGTGLEAVFQVEYKDFAQLDQSRESLLKLGQDIRLAFVDQQGLLH